LRRRRVFNITDRRGGSNRLQKCYTGHLESFNGRAKFNNSRVKELIDGRETRNYPAPSAATQQRRGIKVKNNGKTVRAGFFNSSPKRTGWRTLSYNNSAKSFNICTKSYNARPEGYNARPEGYNARPEGYNARLKSYNARTEGFNARAESYNARTGNFNACTESYNARLRSFNARTECYNACPESCNARAGSFNACIPLFNGRSGIFKLRPKISAFRSVFRSVFFARRPRCVDARRGNQSRRAELSARAGQNFHNLAGFLGQLPPEYKPAAGRSGNTAAFRKETLYQNEYK
jgi:hypothetical protein